MLCIINTRAGGKKKNTVKEGKQKVNLRRQEILEPAWTSDSGENGLGLLEYAKLQLHRGTWPEKVA